MYIAICYVGKVIIGIIMITLVESQFSATSTFETVPQWSVIVGHYQPIVGQQR